MSAPQTGPLNVGARVTVLTDRSDPPQLECHTHLTVVAVDPDGYIVANDNLPGSRRFGPLPRAKLRAGW